MEMKREGDGRRNYILPFQELSVRKSNFRSLRGGTFLWPNKKVPKEVGSGEALTVKSIGTAEHVVPHYPDFKPPSPENPFRPLRVS